VSLTFYIVDVFAEERYSGNQLAVVRGGADLSDETLQKIALEMYYSETTFILSEKEIDGGYDVRIFTPGGEVPFAGHPTLGTAYVIRHEILASPARRITLNLKAGKIPVSFGEGLWMRQLPPTFSTTLDPAQVSSTLRLESADLDDRYLELVGNIEAENVLVFCPEPHENADLSARMFAPGLGFPEDPATGSANGCLAGYLVEHRYFRIDSIDVRVEQGYEIGRPSLLYLRAEKKDEETNIHVGGKVQMVARGELV